MKFLKRIDLPTLAYKHTPVTGQRDLLPGVLFLCGLRADMEGTKARYLEEQCRRRGQACTRFDYSGHGSSEGAFADQTIGLWKDDALAILNEITDRTNNKPVILVGSSLGGWLALLIALVQPEQVGGIVGIAAACDFTRIMAAEISGHESLKEQMEKQGYVEIPNHYDDRPYIITKTLLEEGEKHCLMGGPMDGKIPLTMPVRLLQGMKDKDVPWQTAFRIKNAIGDNAEVLSVVQGDHSLSRPEDLILIDRQVQDLTSACI